MFAQLAGFIMLKYNEVTSFYIHFTEYCCGIIFNCDFFFKHLMAIDCKIERKINKGEQFFTMCKYIDECVCWLVASITINDSF